jgi:hypothetical protein
MHLPVTPNTIATILGAFFLVLAVAQYFRLRKLSEKGVKTYAVIKDLIRSPQPQGQDSYFPVLEYKTMSGEVVTKKSYTGNKKGQQKIGDKVAVVYNPDKPEEFLLDTGMDKYWKVLGSVIAGVVFIAAGVLHLFG